MWNRSLAIACLFPTLYAQLPANSVASAIARHADIFQQKALLMISEETLLQRSYKLPPHPHFAIGTAAETVYAAFFLSEVVSQYSIGPVRGDKSGELLEVREIVSKDGRSIRTPEVARKALQRDISSGEVGMRKRLLQEFTALGLVDVATDYGLILLAFTTAGSKGIELKPQPVAAAWIGTDPVIAFDWQQTAGGVLEFRGRKVNRRPLHGRIWVRRSDAVPLRITASMEHDEPKHRLRDDATVEYGLSASGFVTPASVAHRHFVDEQLLTENLYTYTPFRVFTTDTVIQFTDPLEPGK